MRAVRYSVAMSLDGYIAGLDGSYDWITMDPAIDFAGLLGSFDTMLLGRKTFEAARAQRGGGGMAGMKVFVFSKTLAPADFPEVTIVSEHAGAVVAELKRRPGKDIWLFGGGSLFRSLLEAKQVDSVEVAVMPVLLGGGVPLLPGPSARAHLTLAQSDVLGSGVLALRYRVDGALSPKKRKVTMGASR